MAIGSGAGQTSQSSNSIILNASGSPLNNTTSGLFVNPIRSLVNTYAATPSQCLWYNPVTSEICYNP